MPDKNTLLSCVARASADATLRAYKSDWRLLCAWCAESGYRPLPARDVIHEALRHDVEHMHKLI